MNCACGFEDGKVEALCGAHAEWLRRYIEPQRLQERARLAEAKRLLRSAQSMLDRWTNATGLPTFSLSQEIDAYFRAASNVEGGPNE